MKKIDKDWNRLLTAWRTLVQEHREKMGGIMISLIFAHINDLRRVDNKGIDFAIRRLRASDEYKDKIRLYGSISSDFARCYPLRCYDPFWQKERKYIYVQVKDGE